MTARCVSKTRYTMTRMDCNSKTLCTTLAAGLGGGGGGGQREESYCEWGSITCVVLAAIRTWR